MGLDNGICVSGLKRTDIPNFVKLPETIDYDDGEVGEIDIAYWRKCWGIRNAILSTLHARIDGNNGSTDVDAEDIPAIIRDLMSFCSKEAWESKGNSIWEFEEAFENSLIQPILNLKWLHSYMLSHPKVKCRFYDSY